MDPTTKTLMYIGPFAAGVGIETGQWLERNDPADVDAAIAGRAPDGDDPGEGLLAQTANFTEVAVKGRATPATAGKGDEDA